MKKAGDKMRVFYAVTFHEETKKKLYEYQKMVANNSVKGRFTDPSNFHITLEFIGEVNQEKLSLLTNMLHQLQNRPKELIVSSIGSFKRQNKEIIWLGIEKNADLLNLQIELKELLIKNGFETDKRDYKPHLTIGRQVVRNNPVDEIDIKPIQTPIRSIALMESKRVNNQLVYEPLEEIVL